MPFNHGTDTLEFESYCFVDENDIEKSIDCTCSAGGDYIVDNTNITFNSDFGQILVEQINQLQRNNKNLMEIEQRYRLLIDSLIETIRKRDRTVTELESKLSKNTSNFEKLQNFLKNKLNEMEIYKQKFMREKYINEQLRRADVSEAPSSLYTNEIDEIDDELIDICLVCEHKFSLSSNQILDENCCGIVIDECDDDL